MVHQHIEFINTNAETTGQKAQNDRRARAHAARSISKKHKAEKIYDCGNQRREKYFTAHEQQERISTQQEFIVFRDSDRRFQDADAIETWLATCPTTLSPSFGAVTWDSVLFAPRSYAAETMHYYLTFLAPHVMPLSETRWRLESSYKSPVVFHGLQYASVMHRGIIRNDMTPSERHRMLYHKAETIKLLQTEIANLSQRNLDIVLLVIVSLLREDVEETDFSQPSRPTTLFVPYKPTACWLNVADLIVSSTSLKRPAFAYSSTVDEENLQALSTLHLKPFETAGRGFHNISKFLPSDALMIFVRLAMVDQLMGLCEHLKFGDPKYDLIIKARNAVQHRVLSLPTWSDSDIDDPLIRNNFAYECCRLTSLLYVKSVDFPLPPHTGWLDTLLLELHLLFDIWMIGYTPELLSLQIWSLIICNIAGFRTVHRKFFLATLGNELRKARLSTWPAVRDLVGQYTWADEACAHGALLVWEMLELESGGSAQGATNMTLRT